MRLLVMAVILGVASPCSAGGSFDVDVELKPVTDQIPELWRFLTSTLDLQKSGWANRIGNDVNPRLGGTRLGPYCLLAKPKANPGPYTLEVCINTEYQWFDAAGGASTLDAASRVQERFASVEIKPSKM